MLEKAYSCPACLTIYTTRFVGGTLKPTPTGTGTTRTVGVSSGTSSIGPTVTQAVLIGVQSGLSRKPMAGTESSAVIRPISTPVPRVMNWRRVMRVLMVRPPLRGGRRRSWPAQCPDRAEGEAGGDGDQGHQGQAHDAEEPECLEVGLSGRQQWRDCQDAPRSEGARRIRRRGGQPDEPGHG